ncbi:phospholipase A2 [Nonomuraea candida]|uniref:phospholipase A2 n=1 Tax=Nonomuraea candida TaxID=359159 RepID=UPI000693FD78|nr:phospholipase A2 [Nonomuraea candida]
MGIPRVATVAALCAVALAIPLSPAAAEERTSGPAPQPTREVSITGPGLYIPQTRAFKLAQREEFPGLLDRTHRLTGQENGPFKEPAPPEPRPDLSAFGPGWRAEFLGGLTGRLLDLNDDHARTVELDEGETTRYTLRDAEPGRRTYRAATGSVLTVTTAQDARTGRTVTRATETIAQGAGSGADGSTVKPADLDLVLTWEHVAGAWRVTSAGTAAYGTSTVTYDDQGRVTAMTDLDAGAGPETKLTLTYAGTTTATTDKPGDFAGRLVSVSSESRQSTARRNATYAYDPQGRLRTAVLDDGRTSAYSYDAQGRLTRITTPDSGTWTLSFPATGSRPKAALERPPATGAPRAGLLNYPPTCPYASQWLWHTQAECEADPVAHYGWQPSGPRTTPTGHTVMGINHDHCSSPTGNTPGGYDFTAACDMHDYGFGVIGNSYKLPNVTHHMTPDKKSAVDDVFYTTLTDRTCPAYGSPFGCSAWAWTYRQGVRLGDPRNGADATPNNPPTLARSRT